MATWKASKASPSFSAQTLDVGGSVAAAAWQTERRPTNQLIITRPKTDSQAEQTPRQRMDSATTRLHTHSLQQR